MNSPQAKHASRLRALEHLRAPWILRGSFALLLFVAWELLLGKATFRRDIIDLMALVMGCLAIATLLLDLIERFAVHEMFGALLVMGIGGLLAFTLIDMQPPDDIFLALSSRGLGAYTLCGLAMFASFHWLARGGSWRWLLLLPIGLIAGIWVRWMPYEPTPANDGWQGLIIGGLLWIAAAQIARTSAGTGGLRLRLLPGEAVAALGLMIFAMSARSDARLPDTLTAMVAAALIALCLVMLWFQRRHKERSYASQLADWHPERLRWGIASPLRLVAWLLVIGAGAGVGWLLPRGEGASDPVALIGTLFTAFGLVWLPTVAVVYGWRAIRRDLRAMRL